MRTVLLGVLAIVASIGINKLSNLNAEYSAFNDNLNELAGVRIGQSQEDILYSVGMPETVRMKYFNAKDPDNPDGLAEFPKIELPKGKTVEDYPIWQWHNNGLNLTAYINPETKKVWQLQCMYLADDDNGLRCQTVGGIGLGKENSTFGKSSYRRTEEYVIEYLGKPDKEEFSTVGDTHRKILTYNELGLELVLISREVVTIYKTETNPSFIWWLLHGPKKPIY